MRYKIIDQHGLNFLTFTGVEGIVSKREHYLYSSAKNYAQEEAVLIDVRLMDLFDTTGYIHMGM